MPELPEVEVLVQHLNPVLTRRLIRRVKVFRAKVIRPYSTDYFSRKLRRSRFGGLYRRGKYLVFKMISSLGRPYPLVGHLGMSGRMYMQAKILGLPKHAAVVFDFGQQVFVYEDTRYFGRLTFDDHVLSHLGIDPFDRELTPSWLGRALEARQQAIKVILLDQTVIAGIGNIYASEILFKARIAPQKSAGSLSEQEVERLWRALRHVLSEAIAWGSTVPLNWSGKPGLDKVFYYGRAEGTADYYAEKLRVYDRAGKRCPRCRQAIRRITQASRSTYYCPRCQKMN